MSSRQMYGVGTSLPSEEGVQGNPVLQNANTSLLCTSAVNALVVIKSELSNFVTEL